MSDAPTIGPSPDDATVQVPASTAGHEPKLLGEPGSVLGPYVIQEVLGKGGQGTVFRATEARLGRDVALKILNVIDAGETIVRFRREATIASKIDHPSLCPVYDAGEIDGVPFIAMRLVRGRSMAELIKAASIEGSFFEDIDVSPDTVVVKAGEASTPKPRSSHAESRTSARELERLIGIFEETARALHAIHEAGIVHRDIKPANIMITPEGSPIVMDFGLARSEEAGATLTQESAVFGTPAYMSPEQLEHGAASVDRRSDVWSLGVSLYEAIARRRPFEAPTREALFQAILSREPQSLASAGARVPRDLEVVVATALTKDLNRRYGTAEALADDLRAVRERRPIAARPVGPIGRMVRWSRREPAKAALLLLLFITLPVIAVLVTKHRIDARGRERLRLIDLERSKDELLANAYFELSEGEPGAALSMFRDILGMEGTSPEAAAGVVLSHIAAKDRAAARDAIARSEHLFAGGNVLSELRRRAAAREETDAEPRAAVAPSTPLDYYLLAEDHLEAGEKGDRAAFSKARDAAERAIHLSPAPRYHYYVLALHAASHAKDMPLVATLSEALATHWNETRRSIVWRVFALTETPSVVKLLPSLEAYIAAHPQDGLARRMLASTLFRYGRAPEAEPVLRQLIADKKDIPETHVILARCLTSRGAHEEGITLLDSLIEVVPENVDARRVRAWILARAGRLEEAMAGYRSLIEVKDVDANVEARVNLGDMLRQSGRTKEAREIIEGAIALRPNDPSAVANLGAVCIREGDHEGARKLLERAVELDPKLCPAWQFLGIACAKLGDHRAAVAAYGRACALVPEDAAMLQDRVVTFLDGGMRKDAEPDLRKLVEMKPDALWARRQWGIALMELGRFDESRRVFEEILSRWPDDESTEDQLDQLAIEEKKSGK